MHGDTRRYLIAGLVLLVGAGATWTARAMRGAEGHYSPEFSRVPMVIGEYEAEAREIDDMIFDYLDANAMASRAYAGPDWDIDVSILYGTDWRSIHAPTGCYPAQGWQIVHNQTIEIPAPPDCPHPGPIHVRLIRAVKDEAGDLAMFVYARPGATTADWTAHGLGVATGPRGAGGMIITLRTSVDPRRHDGPREDMIDLLSAIYAPAVSFWYEQ